MPKPKFLQWFAYDVRQVAGDCSGMSGDQEAAYHRLMRYLWDNGPQPEHVLRGRTFGHWEPIAHCFTATDGGLSLAWLEAYRKKAVKTSSGRSVGGKKSAEVRSNTFQHELNMSSTNVEHLVGVTSTFVKAPTREEEEYIHPSDGLPPATGSVLGPPENTTSTLPAQPPAGAAGGPSPHSAPPPSQPDYGKPEINACLAHLRERLAGPLNGKVRDNRRFCHNLLRDMEKEYPQHDPVELVKRLIDAALADEFHGKNAAGFEYLYRHRGTLIQIARAKRPGANGTTQTTPQATGWLNRAPVPE